jgi:hypothetical protein
MRTISGALLILLLLPLSARAQYLYSASDSTSYNTVSVTVYADAGWSSEYDPNCGQNVGPVYPNVLQGLSWQVSDGPGGAVTGSNITQISYANECDPNENPDNVYKIQFSYADTAPGTRSLTMTATFMGLDGKNLVQTTDQLSYAVPGAVTQPNYYILSIVYDAPGNQSTNGFTDSDSNGTMSTISKTFTEGTSFSFGIFLPLGGTWTFGSASGTGNSQSFSETHTSGHGSSIRSLYDHVDHTLDHIYLLLNPQVTIVQTGPNSGTYNLSTINSEPMDVLDFSVEQLQNPSQIPVEFCNPYVIDGVTVPGVCSICADPSNCTAADFAPIVALDLLAAANSDPVPSNNGTNRYVYVTSTILQAPDPDPVTNSFSASDTNLQSETFTQTNTYSVAYSNGRSVTLFGVFTLSFNSTTTWTWSDSQSQGSSSGTTNQAQINLTTSTPGCNSGIDIYEDTVYHTFIAVPSSPLPPACQ